MAEIEITLPTVQYGNVKVRATPEEFGFKLDEPSAFGYALAIYQTSFTLGFKDGSQVDVVAPQGAAQSEVDRVIEETVKAAQILADGLGGVTEVAEDAAPWNKPVVDAPAKPWETEAATW